MAEATYWLMVVGVGGIVVSTLALHFAGSWVFLYPLPFHAAGQWGEVATGMFLSAVLAVGLSIVTWCLAVLDTAVSPALHAVSSQRVSSEASIPRTRARATRSPWASATYGRSGTRRIRVRCPTR